MQRRAPACEERIFGISFQETIVFISTEQSHATVKLSAEWSLSQEIEQILIFDFCATQNASYESNYGNILNWNVPHVPVWPLSSVLYELSS